MATKSFTDTYKIKRSDVSQFRNIMSDTRKLKIRKVKGHQDIRDKEECLDSVNEVCNRSFK